MRPIVLLLAAAGLYGLYAQCTNCTVSGNPILPQGFDPASITLEVGQDTEVVIQFTLPDTATVLTPLGSIIVYPNYAVYVDSLRMASGTSYVVVKNTSSTPVTYGNGALTFDQAPRSKEVSSGTYANVVVYRNPCAAEAGLPSGQLSPPRGCVRACIRGVNPTPAGTGDSLRIRLRAFVDPNSINITFIPPSVSATDICDKDTSVLKPSLTTPLGNAELYQDTTLHYGPVIVQSVLGAIESVVRGGVVVSPNPSWGVAKVRFTMNSSAPVRVRAMDVSGRLISEQDLGLVLPGEHTTELRLPAGIYIVELLAGKEAYRTRLIVLGD